MAWQKRVIRIGAVVCMGAVLAGSSEEAEAFDACDGSFCSFTPCSSQYITEECAEYANIHGCTSTGGMCGTGHPDCDGRTWFYCSGNPQ